MNPFAAAATGLSTRPPSKNELLSFTRRFVTGQMLPWGPAKVLKVVLRFQQNFPNGSWLMYWNFLGGEIAKIADRRAACRAVKDLHKFISYLDPTGDEAVRNVMRDKG